MLESTDVEQVRDWIIVVFLGLTAIASCVGIAFVALIAVKVSGIMEAARQTMKNIRGE